MNSILGECKGNSCLHVLSLELKIPLSHECRKFKWDIFLCFMKKLEHRGMCNPGIWEAEPGGLPQIGGSPGVVYSFDCQLDSTKSHLGKDSGRDFLPWVGSGAHLWGLFWLLWWTWGNQTSGTGPGKEHALEGMFSPIWHSPSDRSISPVVAAENSFTGIRISFFGFPTETEVQHPPRNMPCPWCQISMGETFSLLERRNYQSSWHLQCESAIVGLFRTHRGTQSQTFPCNIYSLCGFCSCGEPTKCLVHQSITVSSVPARSTGWDIVFEKK